MSAVPLAPLQGEAALVWLKVAFLSFGGPAAQIGVMQRLVVDEKGWLDQARFNHALNFCMLLPGPEAQQLATYVGWLLNGVRGGFQAGVLFILPGALLMLGLSLLYVTVGKISLIEGLLFGLKCAVLAIVAQALLRMLNKVVSGRSGLALSLLAFVAMFFFNFPFPLIMLAAAFAGLLIYGRLPAEGNGQCGVKSVAWWLPAATATAWLLPVGLLFALLGPDSVWSQLAGFFSVMSVLSFGGAYAVLAWVAQYAAETQAWINAAEMLDGLGLAETTPGPLILVTQFVGFLAAWRHGDFLHPLMAGSLGGMLTTWVMFTPSFLWIFLLAPHVEKLRDNPRISGALRGITAAVVGVIANLALWFGLRLLFGDLRTIDRGLFDFDLPVWQSLDPWALILTVIAGILLLVFKFGLLRTVALITGLGLGIQWLAG